jgi:SagB-type dehydrogenase family enzyme
VREANVDTPLTLTQLGEFLHWVARGRPPATGGEPDRPLRASPSGGGLYGVEIYPVVNTMSGLATGMYHYDPFGHRLEPVPASRTVIRMLIGQAGVASGGAEPQVLLVLAARFGRVMWKYRSMAYALVLKDVGALMQTMYLVATATGLAPCALGTGDVELFAQATGLDPLVESTVGEFMLSNRAYATPPPP